jgi:hypothetical protein
MRPRVTWTLCATALLLSCRTEVDSAPHLRGSISTRALLDALDPDEGSFVNDECYPCAAATCASEANECLSDPGCSVYHDCLLACPRGDDSALNARCAAECAVASNSTTELFARRLRGCFNQVNCALCLGDGGVTEPTTNDRPECAPRIENPDECNRCLWAECCDYTKACVDDESCISYRDCVLECPSRSAAPAESMECEDACDVANPGGRDPLNRAGSCGTTLCATECNGRADACLDCLEANCGQLSLECMADAECWAMMGCVNQYCGRAADYSRCESDCAAQAPVSGVNQFEQWTECTVGRCLEECSQ